MSEQRAGFDDISLGQLKLQKRLMRDEIARIDAEMIKLTRKRDANVDRYNMLDNAIKNIEKNTRVEEVG